MIWLILLVVLCELFAAVSQVFYKKVVDQNGLHHSLVHIKDYVRFAVGTLKHPLAWAGLGTMALSTVLWLMALSVGDLSLIFPLGSIQYILVLVGSRFFLSEKIDSMRLLGTILITIGIVVISVS
ncbi:MAG: DMT family transporter [Candidatus Omnitrophota bacterium]